MDLFEFEETGECFRAQVMMMRKININNYRQPEPKQKKPQQPKCPYRKGSRKFKLYKKLNKVPINSTTNKFHDKRLSNYMIHDQKKNGSIEARRFTTKTKSTYEDLTDPKDTYFMVNCGDNIFIRLSAKSYFKLSRLRKIIIISQGVVRDDGAYEDDVLYSDSRVFDTINGLLRALTEERIRCDCIYETQIKNCGYSLYDFRYKIMTLDKSGKYKYYDDINRFCRQYHLTLI